MTKRTTGALDVGAASQRKKGSVTPHPKSISTSKNATGKAAKIEGTKTDSGNLLDADALLKADHRKVEKLFQEYKSAEESEDKKRLCQQICTELIVHTELEEELFYPACRAAGVEDDRLDKAQVEHDGAKVLITQLITLPADSAYYDAKVQVLSEYIKHHVGEEERPGDGIFAKARSAGVDMTALGKQLQSRKEERLAQGEDKILQPPIPRSLDIPDFINRSFKENQTMANHQNRDDQGRFTHDGNRGSSNGRYAHSDEYDDNRHGSRSNSQAGDRSRDDDGRFTSADNRDGGGYDGRGQHDDEARSGHGRSNQQYNNYEDDHSYGRQGRGQSHGQGQGWYGDREGHAQAAHRGHGGDDDGRGDDRSSGNYGGRDDQGRSHGGWFGDAEGHSEAARRGHQSSSYAGRRDDDDGRDDYRASGNRGNQGRQGQGRGGWFGDPEGHAEAGRHSHQSSSRSDRGANGDDKGDYRASGNHDGRNGQGHGGWFGDSRGHADAARRGWDNR